MSNDVLVVLGAAVVYAAASLVFRRRSYSRGLRLVLVLVATGLIVWNVTFGGPFSYGRLAAGLVVIGMLLVGMRYAGQSVGEDSGR